ncbi:winged helix-turn-helix domain-containing protein [Paenibacillus aurantiacus]|uniref:Winged helix-turn-helix domain-containing protein n=1 Tax=Paenibacillus aurantiacus TaxID=1936118 RepID=A0ABV5KT09_9BACL
MVIVWAEDERRLLEGCVPFLESEGYTVHSAPSYAEAVALAERVKPDLLIVDWMLDGKLTGLDLCKHNERSWRIPVIMVTAKEDEFDKVLALEIGADDYIQKPFGLRELNARMKAVLRRTKRYSHSDERDEGDPSVETVLSRGELTIYPCRHAVKKSGVPLDLTATEFKLLMKLAAHPGRVYTRALLLDEALGEAFLGFERTVDSHIRNLRRKLEDDQSNPDYVLTVYGVGYKFNEEMGR